MKTVGVALILLCASGLMVAAGCQQTTRPAGEGADVLASLLRQPVLTEETEGLQSLDVLITATSSAETMWAMRTHFVFRRPAQFRSSWEMGGTGVPMAIMAEGTALLFDAINRVVSVRKSGTPRLMVYQDGDDLIVTIGGEKKFDHVIYVDAASIFKHLKASDRAPAYTRDPDGKPGSWIVRWTGKDGQPSITFGVGPDPLCPLTSIRVGDDAHPSAIVAIRANQPIGDEDLLLPDLAVLARYVRVDQSEYAGLPAFMQDFQNMLVGMAAALGKTPEKRAEVEKTLGVKIDWDAAEAFARRLKEGLAEARRARVAAPVSAPEVSRRAE
jgi:hypothetical protein